MRRTLRTHVSPFPLEQKGGTQQERHLGGGQKRLTHNCQSTGGHAVQNFLDDAAQNRRPEWDHPPPPQGWRSSHPSKPALQA